MLHSTKPDASAYVILTWEMQFGGVAASSEWMESMHIGNLHLISTTPCNTAVASEAVEITSTSPTEHFTVSKAPQEVD